VLKNRETNKELFVINVELLPTEQAKNEGAEKPKEKVEEKVSEGGDDDDLD
jgi:hypothetical protein